MIDTELEKEEAELEKLEEEKSEILKSKDEEKLIRIKKAIPVLADCLKEYDKVNIPQKNQFVNIQL